MEKNRKYGNRFGLSIALLVIGILIGHFYKNDNFASIFLVLGIGLCFIFAWVQVKADEEGK